jgi:hypothetical protein
MDIETQIADARSDRCKKCGGAISVSGVFCLNCGAVATRDPIGDGYLNTPRPGPERDSGRENLPPV